MSILFFHFTGKNNLYCPVAGSAKITYCTCKLHLKFRYKALNHVFKYPAIFFLPLPAPHSSALSEPRIKLIGICFTIKKQNVQIIILLFTTYYCFHLSSFPCDLT